MLIGELAKKVGVTRDTIRFYEKEGLISSRSTYNPNNNYKVYGDDAAVTRLQTIKKIKALGFTLEEISGFLKLIESGNASCGNVMEKMSRKLSLIDEKISGLLALNKWLHLCC